ncbi:hypothetical protein [Microbacterium terricola]|uniref:Uncharacterized protein n=1 Tax=Microbacterium terricola TaxID=344163 RepID=A0ABM8E160_9MICO|nr:hypothetical protein [Microbacterium terricola]UYK40597.1 hypothetical protein OAU46_02780 [Microbacterium terricola]BDV31673.1 hypothetical protein Microterr_23330 [Microbacterium terricola]
MGLRTSWNRVKNAIFGKPLSHEEAQARHEAQVATQRQASSVNGSERGRQVQNQSYWF